MSNRIEAEICRLAGASVAGAEAHGRGDPVCDLNGPTAPARRRGLSLVAAAVLLVGLVGVGLLLSRHGSGRLDTTGPGPSSSVTWPPPPSCLDSGPDTSVVDVRRSDPPGASSDQVAARLRTLFPDLDVVTNGQRCGFAHVTAFRYTDDGPSSGSLSVIYAYGAPDRDVLADYRADDPGAQVLSDLPHGLVGVVNSAEVDHSRALSIEQVVPAGQSPVLVTVVLAADPGAVTDGQLEQLALSIITTVPPPS